MYEQNHTLLNYSAFLYNVGKCRGEGVQRKGGKKAGADPGGGHRGKLTPP